MAQGKRQRSYASILVFRQALAPLCDLIALRQHVGWFSRAGRFPFGLGRILHKHDGKAPVIRYNSVS